MISVRIVPGTIFDLKEIQPTPSKLVDFWYLTNGYRYYNYSDDKFKVEVDPISRDRDYDDIKNKDLELGI